MVGGVGDLHDRGDKAIADTAHGGDEARIARFVEELAAQAIDDDAQGIAAVGWHPPPHSADDVVALQRHIGPGHQEGQQGVLGWRQQQLLPAQGALLGPHVDNKVRGAQVAHAGAPTVVGAAVKGIEAGKPRGGILSG